MINELERQVWITAFLNATDKYKSHGMTRKDVLQAYCVNDAHTALEAFREAQRLPADTPMLNKDAYKTLMDIVNSSSMEDLRALTGR